MNWKAISYLTLIAGISGVFFSCYKTKNFSTNLTAQIDTAIVIQSNDQARVTAILDQVFNDVNTAMISQSAITGAATPRNVRYGVTVAGVPDTISVSGICGGPVITLDTASTDALHYISITYNGYSCDNSRYLSGNVTVYFNPGTSWSNALDTVGVDITKLTVIGEQNGDTNTIRLNGTFYYTNVTGGSLSTLTAGSTPIVHEIISPYLGVLFNSADTATWQVARKRTYTNNGSGIVISTTGMDTVGGILNVSEWGGNRFANSFIASIDTPLVSSAGCSYQVGAGQVTLTNPAGVTILNFGLNASGAPTGCPVSGSSYYFQFSWTGSDSGPYSSVRPYPFYGPFCPGCEP